MFTVGTLVEAFFEGGTPKWKLAYVVSYNPAGFLCIRTAAANCSRIVNVTDIRIPNFDEDHSRGFTYGLTKRKYISSECDEWRRGYIMGVVARVGG
ncbi:MAG: hypothetical protein ACT4O2_01870 [Beijerinckiaceae bacterium]